MRIVTSIALAAALAASAAAATADKTFSVTGAGGVPCSQIAADLASGKAPSGEIASWLQGYATATNRNTDDSWELMGPGGIEAYYKAVQDYCAAHGDLAFETAAFDVLKAGYDQRLKTKP